MSEPVLDDGVVRIAWRYDINLDTIAPTKSQIDETVTTDGVRELVIDLDGIEFLDSLGVGALIHARSRCEVAGIALRIQHIPPRTRRLLEVTGVANLFDLEV